MVIKSNWVYAGDLDLRKKDKNKLTREAIIQRIKMS